MALTGIPGTVYLRAAWPELKERLRLLGLTVLDEPANLAAMLAQSAVIVHHGGSTANVILKAGRPQILVPQHLEQVTTAQLLARMGVAVFLLANASPDAAGRALRQVLDERRFADCAASWARRLQERMARPGLPAILQRCRHYLEG
jgi:UDP:flavonoid glycosyltransferase YjiC (YdhE family)